MFRSPSRTSLMSRRRVESVLRARSSLGRPLANMLPSLRLGLVFRPPDRESPPRLGRPPSPTRPVRVAAITLAPVSAIGIYGAKEKSSRPLLLAPRAIVHGAVRSLLLSFGASVCILRTETPPFTRKRHWAQRLRDARVSSAPAAWPAVDGDASCSCPSRWLASLHRDARRAAAASAASRCHP